MRILLAVAALAALVVAPARAQVVGEQRLAVRLVTWGPEPVALADARAVVAATDGYIRANSFGRTWLNADVAGWLRALPARPAGCDTQGIDAAVRRAEPGLAAYPRVAYLLPPIDCPWGGAYFPPGVWMLGRITVELLAHELGHNYGVTEEGPAWVCAAGSCEVESYGDPFSVMGHGSGHFGAYEKYVFGWIERVRAGASGRVTIARIDVASDRPHALHVLAGGEEYWLEVRPETPGLVVHGGPALVDPAARSRFPQRNLLLAAGVPRFAVPGAFEVSVAAQGAEEATLDLRWTDRTRPSRPRLTVAGRGRLVTLRFPATDAGSGIASYELAVDGRRRARLETVQELGRTLGGRDPELELRLAPGRRRVSVVAVDRAGNRSPAAVRTVRVR
jgi:hypothetical protein